MNLSSYMYRKLIQRAWLVVLNSTTTLLTPFGNMLISVLLLRYKPADFYGELAFILITFDFFFNIISWGDTGYLFRDFSLRPARIKTVWQEAFFSRSPLLLPLLVLVFFSHYSIQIKFCFCVWILTRYIYRSFDAVFQYNRDFKMQLFVELTSFVIILTPIIIYLQELTFTTLILIYTLSYVLKSTLALLFYKKNFISVPSKFISINYFVAAFPFLMISFSGMLESKADLYSVAWFLKKEELAQYQIFSGFLSFSQLGASLLLAPFGKNLFRLPLKTFKKLELLFAKSGILFSFVFISIIFIIIQFIYKINIPAIMYVTGYFFMLPSFLYLPSLFACSKQNKQSTIVFITLIGSVINISLGFILTPVFMKEGALISGTLTQWAILALFLVLRDKRLNFFGIKW